MGRWLAVDYGRRRIGLALCDAAEAIASPLPTMQGAAKPATDAAKVAKVATDYAADGVVVGLPLNMDGSIGPQAKLSQAFADALRAAAPRLPVELHDERLSSFQADQTLAAAGLPPEHARQRRDAAAAVVILESFLAQRRRHNL